MDALEFVLPTLLVNSVVTLSPGIPWRLSARSICKIFPPLSWKIPPLSWKISSIPCSWARRWNAGPPASVFQAVPSRGAAPSCRHQFRNRDTQCPGETLDIVETDIALPAFDSARSEEHTSELQSLMRISYAVFCLKKKI